MIKAVKINKHWSDVGSQFAEPGQCFDTCENYLCFACPGCGNIGNIKVGSPKPEPSPSWNIVAGSVADLEHLTLTPSILCKGCCGWHGWLVKGVFQLKPPEG
jgi:Family of unknown function (DUF6527)